MANDTPTPDGSTSDPVEILTGELQAVRREVERLQDMNATLTRMLEGKRELENRHMELLRTRADKIAHQADTIREFGRDRTAMSKRIGELAASNFGLRLRAKTAEKQLKNLLKLDTKARKAGIGHS